MTGSATSVRFSYEPGTRVQCRGEEWIIHSQIGSDQLMLEGKSGERTIVVKSYEVTPPSNAAKAKPVSAIPDDDYQTAKERYEILEPVLNGARRDRGKLVKDAAKSSSNTVQTIYGWIRKFETTGTISSLAPRRKGSQRGDRRIDAKVEAIIHSMIEREYLNKQRKSVKSVYTQIEMACADAGISKPPCLDTVRKRIQALPPREVTAKRFGEKVARDKFDAAAGKFPNGEHPLQTVQIDHTVLDIILVNRKDREPTTRPTLTIAIDVFSGMVAGLHLSFEPPSVTSVGMCLYRSVTHKDRYLKELGVDGDWPVWGLPVSLHVDNAKEFQSNSLREGCAEHGIDLQHRPVRRPEFGGHVERTFRSINTLIHELPGTTKSNIQDRGEYKSEKEALLTIDELEKLLVGHIVNKLHTNPRRSDGASPFDRWEEGIRAVGQPKPIQDTRKFLIDFLPQESRTVQTTGIQWGYIYYFDLKIKKWIGSKRDFKVKRDPRDISKIYFLDPELGEYLEIHTADGRLLPFSLAEHNAAIARLKAAKAPRTQSRIYAEVLRQRETEEAARKQKRSKKARRKSDQDARNRRELNEIHGSATSESSTELQVIEGGLARNSENSDKRTKRTFKLRPKDGQKRYEDW